MKTITKIIAQAGFENTAANTIESIKSAIKLNIHFITIDVQYSLGIVYLSHTKLAEREIENALKLEELLAYNRENNAGLKFNLNLISPDALNACLRILAEYDMLGNVFFSGKVFPNATAIFDFSYFLNIENIKQIPYINTRIAKELVSYYKEIKDKRCVGYNVNHSILSKNAIKEFKKNNIMLCVWTVDFRFQIKKYIQLGVDYIISNHPNKGNGLL